MRKLARDNLLRNIVWDECHTAFGEQFRQSYDDLTALALFTVPVTALSGSMPLDLVPSFMSSMNLARDDSGQDYNQVFVNDLVGSYPVGFQFNVYCGVLNITKSVVRRIKEILEGGNQASIHVLCSTVAMASEIQGMLVGYEASVLTSKVSREEQAEIGRKWMTNDIPLLLSTTCCLVGNENENCEHSIVAGSIHSVMNLVQAIGRLRPAQRKETGSIDVYLPFLSSAKHASTLQKTKQTSVG